MSVNLGRRIVYLAHPVSGDVAGNLAAAKRWIRVLYDNFEVAVLANWILDCEVLDDANPEHRARGLEHDLAIIPRCDVLIAVGPRVSTGMALEWACAEEHGLPRIDATGPWEQKSVVALIRDRFAAWGWS